LPWPSWSARGFAVLFWPDLHFWRYASTMTLVPTRRGYHRTLFWSFFVIMPQCQYNLIWHPLVRLFRHHDSSAGVCLRADTASRLRETRRIFWSVPRKFQFGSWVCAYCLSHAPGHLLLLKIPALRKANARLLLYLVIVDSNERRPAIWWGQTARAGTKSPWRVSPTKTWEGFSGGF